MQTKKIALVTGANRGLGLETAKQLGQAGYKVYLAARTLENAEKAARLLIEQGLDIIPIKLDIASEQDAALAAKKISNDVSSLDALVNNAGVFLEEASSALDPNFMGIKETFDVNTLGALRVTTAFIPLMRSSKNACVVNVSSGMGQLSEMQNGSLAYRISKTALNAVTKILSEELSNSSIKVNSVCPGWVKTDMGGAGAERDIPTGARGIVWAATLPADGPTGGFFRDGKPLDW